MMKFKEAGKIISFHWMRGRDSRRGRRRGKGNCKKKSTNDVVRSQGMRSKEITKKNRRMT